MKGNKYDKTLKHALGPNYTLPSVPVSQLADTDEKVEAIVKFIARRAAESDYAELLRAIENKATIDSQEQ